jgi:hypothetical protein
MRTLSLCIFLLFVLGHVCNLLFSMFDGLIFGERK